MNIDRFISQLSTITAQELPGDKAHLTLMPVSRLKARKLNTSALDLRLSAVGIILYPFKNSIYSVLIQRPQYDGIHSGQIAFPGGKMDSSDVDLIATARRECHEEVDFQANDGRLISQLSEIYIPVSNFKVHPFVFFTKSKPLLTPDEREVEEIIHFDLFSLLAIENFKTKSIRISSELTQENVPYFDIKGKIVWGATAMILAELKAIIQQIKI